MVLRSITGSKPDARGWGMETYVSALVHQAITTVFGLSLMALHFHRLNKWLVGSEHGAWHKIN